MNISILLKFLIYVKTIFSVDLTIDLHKYDVFSVLSEDVLSYDSIEDNLHHVNSDQLSIQKDSSIKMMVSYLGDLDYNSYKFKKIHDIIDYENYFAMLLDYDQYENSYKNQIYVCSLAQMERQNILDQKKVRIDCSMQDFTSEEYKCGQMQMDDVFVYAPCISLVDSTFQLCKKNYIEDTISQCILFKTEFQLTAEQIEDEDLGLTRYKNKTGDVIFLLFFKNSKVQYYHNRFFLIRENKFEVLEIPIRNFVIGKMEIYSYQKNYDKILIFLTKFSGFQQDLLMMTIQDGYVQKDFLKNSVIKTNIRSFDYSNNSLIIFDEDQASSILTMTQLSIDLYKDQKIQIPNINYLLRNSYKDGISVLETFDNTNQKKFFMYNSFTQRYFELKQIVANRQQQNQAYNAIKKMQDFHWWFVLAHKGRHYFMILDQKKGIFDMYTVQDVKYIKVSIKNPLRPEKLQVVSFKDSEQTTLNLTVNFCEFDEEKFYFQNEYLSVPDKQSRQRLRLYANNLQLDQDISYFNKLQIVIDYGADEEEIKNQCEVNYETMNTKYYLIFCKNGKLIVFFNIHLTRSTLKLSNHKIYQTNYFKKIDQVKIHHNETIIIITQTSVKSSIHYAMFDRTSRESEKLNFITEKRTIPNKTNCYFLSHGICCRTLSTNKRVVYDYVQEQNDFKLKLYYTEYLDRENQLKDFFSFDNSFINKEEFSFIRKDLFFENYWFMVMQNNIFIEKIEDMQIQQRSEDLKKSTLDPGYYIDQDTTYHYISTNNHIIITQIQPDLLFYGLYEGSYINYPNYMKNYKYFYKVFRDPRENVFLMTYYTTEGHFRGSLYKSNVKHLFNRLIQDFLIEDQKCIKPQVHTKLLGYQFLIISVCDNNRQQKKVWKYNLQGPIINVDGHSNQQTVNINSKDYILNFKYKKLHKKTEIKINKIKILEVPKTELELDLEENGNLIMNGDYRDIVQLDNRDKTKIISRDKFIEEVQLSYMLKGFRVLPEVYMTFDQQKPLLLFGNYIYSNKKLDINYRYKKCKHINPTYYDNKFLQFYKKLFICQEKSTSIYKITDFIDIHIQIPNEYQTSNEVYAPMLLQIKSRLYIFYKVQVTGKTLFLIRTYFSSSNDQVSLQIEKVNVINADSYTHQLSPIHSYYPFYNSVLNSIILLLQPYNSQLFYLLTLNLIDHQIDKKDTKTLWFTETTRINMYRCDYQQIDDELIIVGSSEYLIYEFRIWYENNWQYELVESFMNPMGNLKGEEILKKNENYIVMLYDRKDSKTNILVWKRKQRKRNIPIFTTISQKDFQISQYRLENIGVVYDKNDKKDYIYVAYFKSYNKEKNRYHSFHINKIQIGNVKLQINSSLMKFQETVTFRIFQFDNSFVQFELPIVFKEKTKLFQFQLMCYFLIFLVVLLVGILSNCIYTNFQIEKNIKIWQAKQKVKREDEEFESQMIQSNFE